MGKRTQHKASRRTAGSLKPHGSLKIVPKVHYGVNHGMWFFVIFNLDGGSYENERTFLWKKNAVRAAKQKCAEIGIPYVCGSDY